MNSTKSKRKFVPLKVKLEALKRLDKGETLKKLAAEYGVGEVTVDDWRRNTSKLEAFSTNKCSNLSLDRTSLKKSEYEKAGETLYMWFTQQRQKGCPLSGPILQEKALLFRNEFAEGDENFTASVGGLDKWRKGYGIRQLEVCGEKLSADSEAVVKFCKKLKNENLTNDQFYNCDETGLNFKMLPSETLASREEKSTPGHKKRKERLTLLATSNASGNHKIKLVVIGKASKPRAFKHTSIYSLPVTYRNQKSVWMTQEIFKNWFLYDFVPEVKKILKEKNLSCKAILTLDNACSHPNEDELNCDGIRAMFLPPNVTSLI
ncbi:Jerky -like [Araneus ventricosus]|uniref:Jerky-like n=1 Tax=Araneus ventricosus TaxID=182803 RepID=A0A4Y1ZY36_ARAVE|nr:Jerky -like [Araneus ventricosus]